MKPELYLRRLHFKTRCVRGFRWNVIPIACAVAGLLAIKVQDEFALGDDANVHGVVAMGWYDRASGIRREQDVAALRLQLECVERPVECRQVAKQFWKMRHIPVFSRLTSSFSGAWFASAASFC